MPAEFQFIPDQVQFDELFHQGKQDQHDKVCVIHAINSIAGCWFLQHPRQFLNVYKSIYHRSLADIEKLKMKEGIKVYKLKNILTDGKKIYSLKEALFWDEEKIKDQSLKNRFITNEMYERNITKCLMGVEMFAGYSYWLHANTWKWTGGLGWALMDHYEETIKYEFFPKTKMKEYLNLKEYFSKIRSLKVFILEEEPYDEEKFKKVYEKMQRNLISDDNKQNFQKYTHTLSQKNKKSKKNIFRHDKSHGKIHKQYPPIYPNLWFEQELEDFEFQPHAFRKNESNDALLQEYEGHQENEISQGKDEIMEQEVMTDSFVNEKSDNETPYINEENDSKEAFQSILQEMFLIDQEFSVQSQKMLNQKCNIAFYNHHN